MRAFREIDDWRLCTLGDVIISKPHYGLTARSSSKTGKLFYLRISDITDEGELKNQDLRCIDSDLADVGKYELNENDLLIARSGSVGRVYIHKGLGRPAVFASYLIRFRLDETKVLPKYVFYWGLSPGFKKEIAIRRKVVAQPNINAQDYRSFRLRVPPLNVQKNVVAMLERANDLRRKRKQATDYANGIVESVFLKMFGGDKYLREEIRDHVLKTEVKDPRRVPDARFKYVDIGGIDNKTGRIVEAKDILGKDAPSRARRVIQAGDVLVSTVRPNLNATALVPPELDNQICSTGFSVLRCRSSLDSHYLYAFTRRKEFIRLLGTRMKGASYPAVTNDDVLDVKIPVPPVEIQKRFSTFMKGLESLVEKQRQN